MHKYIKIYLISIFLCLCNKTKDINDNKIKEYIVKNRESSNYSIKYRIKNKNSGSEDFSNIVLKEINPKYTKQLHLLVKRNKNHLIDFMPTVNDDFGTNYKKCYKCIDYYVKHSGYLTFIIIYNNEVAGCLGLQSLDYQGENSVDVSYWLGKEYCSKGLMRNSLKILLDALFLKENEEIISKKQFRNKSRINIILKWDTNDISQMNEKSNNLAKKLKFTLLPKKNNTWDFKKWCYSEKPHESLVYTMTKSKWINLRKNSKDLDNAA